MRPILLASALSWASAAILVSGAAVRHERVIEPTSRRTELPQSLDNDRASHIGDGSALSEYTTNWAGAVLIGAGYKVVSGTIVVPKPSMPVGGSSKSTYTGSAWVGIDGSTCPSAILQTGIDYSVKEGKATYAAWYEWYPDYAGPFTGFQISGGDTLSMTVIATGTNSGSVTLDNKTTGKSVSHIFANQTGDLCYNNAEWIVEDFVSAGNPLNFANFSTVAFTDAKANGAAELDKAVIYDIKQGNKVLTKCSTLSTSSVTCSYMG